MGVWSAGGNQNKGFIIALWDTPDHMNRVFAEIQLQEQSEMTLREIRVLFDQGPIDKTLNDFACRKTLFRQFIITMVSDPDLAQGQQSQNSVAECRQA